VPYDLRDRCGRIPNTSSTGCFSGGPKFTDCVNHKVELESVPPVEHVLFLPNFHRIAVAMGEGSATDVECAAPRFVNTAAFRSEPSTPTGSEVDTASMLETHRAGRRRSLSA